MWIGVITLFPEMFDAVTQYGVTGRAVKNGTLRLNTWNPRDFTQDRHRTVDDRPYGGGPGMLMKVQPLRDAIHCARAEAPDNAKVIYLSPQGKQMNQAMAKTLVNEPGLILLAGRYEGVDERLIQSEVDEEISIGDFVLSGGEIPAMALIDAVARMIPGVLGHEDSAMQDSFYEGLLDCPHYTRPEIYGDVSVPAVLLGGNHEQIRRWRLKQSLGRTWQRRPDLLSNINLSTEQRNLLEEFIRESEAVG